jgi:Ca2+-binding EF-hand superfamily protein
MFRFGLVLVPLLFTCVTEAQTAQRYSDLLERMDADHDGSIKRDEFLATREQLFVNQDEDPNGYLDKNEIGERKGRRGARDVRRYA